MKIRTHYDNLMVARNAPTEVITAAYRSLCFKFHPDRNPSDPRAARIMGIINRSYDVLSDPVQRQAHDQWIATQERVDSHSANGGPRAPEADVSQDRYRADADAGTGYQVKHIAAVVGRHVLRNILVYGMIVFVAVVSLMPSPPPEPSGLAPYDASPEPEGSAVSELEAPPAAETNNERGSATEVTAGNQYVRPKLAPNGSPWPAEVGYVDGYPRERTNGLSEVTIDNSANGSDVFVKLVAIDASKTVPIRHAFIPAHEQFTMQNVRAGQYDVRYMDLSDGSLLRSESFNLTEVEEPGGVRYSSFTMTLYKVAHGNMQTYSLSPSEF